MLCASRLRSMIICFLSIVCRRSSALDECYVNTGPPCSFGYDSLKIVQDTTYHPVLMCEMQSLLLTVGDQFRAVVRFFNRLMSICVCSVHSFSFKLCPLSQRFGSLCYPRRHRNTISQSIASGVSVDFHELYGSQLVWCILLSYDTD